VLTGQRCPKKATLQVAQSVKKAEEEEKYEEDAEGVDFKLS
jgi:hypothetical protein